MNITFKKMMIITALIAFMTPFVIHTVVANQRSAEVEQALQVAKQSTFQGITAEMVEYLTCGPTKEPRVVAQKTTALAPDGTLYSEIRDSDESDIRLFRGDGVRAWWYPNLKRKTTILSQKDQISPPAIWLRNPSTDCLMTFKGTVAQNGEIKVGTETVLGEVAIKTVHEGTDRRETNWYWPRHGCFTAQYMLEHWDPAKGKKIESTSLTKVVSFKVGDLDHSKKNPPADFIESSPREVGEARLKQKLKKQNPSWDDEDVEVRAKQLRDGLPAKVREGSERWEAQYTKLKKR